MKAAVIGTTKAATCTNLGRYIGRGTIAEILARNGLEPAPEREPKTTWREFLEQHWDLIVAADFFTIEAWTRRGLQRFMVLFLIELSTRKVEIAGIAPVANGMWMNQIARNLSAAADGVPRGKRFLIRRPVHAYCICSSRNFYFPDVTGSSWRAGPPRPSARGRPGRRSSVVLAQCSPPALTQSRALRPARARRKLD